MTLFMRKNSKWSTKMDLGLIVSLGVELIIAAVAVGVMKQKTDSNERGLQELRNDLKEEIKEITEANQREYAALKEDTAREIDSLKSRQDKTDAMFSEIQRQLSSIQEQQAYIKGNVDLLIAGKINTQGGA